MPHPRQRLDRLRSHPRLERNTTAGQDGPARRVGVGGAFPRADLVRMARLQREARTAILKAVVPGTTTPDPKP